MLQSLSWHSHLALQYYCLCHALQYTQQAQIYGRLLLLQLNAVSPLLIAIAAPGYTQSSIDWIVPSGETKEAILEKW